VRRKVFIELELDEHDANLIAADLVYLLEHTKNLPGIVKVSEAPFTIESRERLGELVRKLKEMLHVQS